MSSLSSDLRQPSKLSPTSSAPLPVSSLRRERRPRPRPPRTSEFWYEDEEEFDAIAGSLRRKTVYIVEGGGEAATTTATSTIEAAAAQLSSVSFDACFYGQGGDEDKGASSCAPALAALWPPSRSGPPYFLKPRRRPALDALSRLIEAGSEETAETSAAAAAAADSAWSEIASQNWRVELAYGLGGGAGGGRDGSEGLLADPERPESILVVVSPPGAADALTGAAIGRASPPDPRRPYSVITLREWEGGESADAAAPGWRDLLEKS